MSESEKIEEDDLDDGNRSIIMGIIAQLRKGTDLHRVTLPTFVLETRSMCERLSDFFTYNHYLFKANDPLPPDIRMINVLKYFFSGWQTRPKGVKKPFNPILGEFFRCTYAESDGTQGIYVCEQVSHHPPISAFFYGNATKGIAITGELRPRARFLGNSAATMMEGGSVIHLKDDVISVIEPNVYARSILFGTMYMELGDQGIITSKKHDIACTIDFKQKGMFGGSDKDLVTGKIAKKNGEILYKIKGKWSEKIFITDNKGKEELLFDGSKEAPPPGKTVAPESEQEEFESRRLWNKVALAVKKNDHDTATTEKTKIEDNQRVLVKSRTESNIEWESRFFVKNEDDEWVFALLDQIANKPQDPKVLHDFIFSKPTNSIHKQFWV